MKFEKVLIVGFERVEYQLMMRKIFEFELIET